MHIYFSGIGGTGLGPLALICKQAGFKVSGSDMQHSQYTDYLFKQGIDLHIGQSEEQITVINSKNKIDWIVFSSAVFINNPNHPELIFAKNNGIKSSKRDECLNMIIKNKGLKLIAVAGTHGKTSTTAILIWLFKQFNIPLSYSVGAKISFGPMGHYDDNSQYFVYECDEFDRNFLSFNPEVSLLTSVDWDHHEIYPTRKNYIDAFLQFINQSRKTFIYDKDASYLSLKSSKDIVLLNSHDDHLKNIKLAGLHNRQNAFLCTLAFGEIYNQPINNIFSAINSFPGANRRFEKLADNIYTDYGHTPEEISATLQMANEISDNITVAYEPLTNRRQYYMKDLYKDVFKNVDKVYWLPSYLAREDPKKPILTPKELIRYLDHASNAEPALKNRTLKNNLIKAAQNGSLVICIAGGGGGSLDEWARNNLVEK